MGALHPSVRGWTLYTGIARDAEKRLKLHESGKGAKYTRGRGPLRLVYRESCENRTRALQREIEVKKLTRAQKDALIARKEDTAETP